MITSFMVMAEAVLPEAVGVTVTVPCQTSFATAAASSPVARRLDHVQHRRGAGPCIAALDGSKIHVCLQDQREWPELADAGAKEGVHAVLSMPLTIDDQIVGSFTLYSREPGVYPADSALVAALGEHAARTLSASRALEQAEAKVEHLLVALESRELIGEAKGIIMASQRCTPDEAFDVLRTRSQRANRKLRDVARDLVEACTGQKTGPAVFSR